MKKYTVYSLMFIVAFSFLSGCSLKMPVPKKLEIRAPYTNKSVYTNALSQLGKMSIIYNCSQTNIQSDHILDDTGASLPLATGGEIQRNITEIMKTSLNSIGGKVRFIEYNPSYINNQIATGYSKFPNKIVPDVVITGGITGFDRGLETMSDVLDVGVDVSFPDIQNNKGNLPPSDMVGVSYSDAKKKGLARISVDFNMKDFQTLAGIPYMSTTNNMMVGKHINERELSISLFGPTLGLKGTNTRVQGRHEAIRVLVQLSTVQMVGKYLAIPYWRLLNETSKEDSIVKNKVDQSFYAMNEFERIVNIQQWLYLHKYPVNINGKMDEKTIKTLEQYVENANAQYKSSALEKGRQEGKDLPDDSKLVLQKVPALSFDPEKKEIGKALYSHIYLNLPIDDETYARRLYLNKALGT